MMRLVKQARRKLSRPWARQNSSFRAKPCMTDEDPYQSPNNAPASRDELSWSTTVTMWMTATVGAVLVTACNFARTGGRRTLATGGCRAPNLQLPNIRGLDVPYRH